jgi:3-oxoadipate enol-lactonase
VPTVEIDDIRLAYEIVGESTGYPVVLVAGLADDLRSWDSQVPALVDAGMQVIRFDNRGIGGSSVPPGPYTTRRLAADVIGLADSLALAAFHLVGNSLGGMIAQQIAREHPHRVRRLVLSCTATRCGPVTARLFDNWAWSVPRLGFEAFARDVVLWSFCDAVTRERPEMMDQARADLLAGEQTEVGFLNQLHAVRHHDSRDWLPAVATPCLVLAGREDRIFPSHHAHELAALLPNATLTFVDGGHACQWEFVDAYNDALRRFLLAP